MTPFVFWKRKLSLTLLWTFVVIVMTLFFTIGFSLYYTASKLPEFVEENNKTVALIGEETVYMGDGKFKSTILTEDDAEFLKSMESVKDVHINTSTGAYSSDFYAQLAWDTSGTYLQTECYPYNNGIVIGEIDYITNIGFYQQSISIDGEDPVLYNKFYYRVIIEVEDLFLFNDVYTDGVFSDFGYVDLSLNFYSLEETVPFEVGERYIFYIDNYRDRQNGFWSGPTASCSTGSTNELPFVYKDGELRSFDSIETVYKITNGSDYSWQYFIGYNKPLSETEYIPAVSKIEGSLDEFLAENKEWKDLFTQLEIVNGCLPVVGTDCIETQYAFIKDKAKIVEGRTFTESEYKNGEKVLIISKSIAEKSSLKVGDKIKLSQFLLTKESGRSEEYGKGFDYAMNINPTIGSFVAVPKFDTVDEEFTIIGIYDQSEKWSLGLFSFTPNTVFMPKSAQISGGYGGFGVWENMEYENSNTGEIETSQTLLHNGSEGIGLAVEIKNGMLDEFRQEISETSLDGIFLTFDQGYEESIIAANLLNSMGRNLFMIVAAGWVLLLALYILLYQMKQNKTLGIMRSVGTTKIQTMVYIFVCGAVPAAIGVTVGSFLSGHFVSYIQNLVWSFTLENGGLADSNESISSMLTQNTIEPKIFIYAAIMQLVVFLIAILIFGLIFAVRPPRKLSAK